MTERWKRHLERVMDRSAPPSKNINIYIYTQEYLDINLSFRTAKWAIEGDMGWKSCLVKQRCGICLVKKRLIKKIFNWERTHSYPWSREVSAIFSLSDLHFVFRNNLQCYIYIVKQKLLMSHSQQ